MSFFKGLSADKLGCTKIVAPAEVIGRRGQLYKLLDISLPDDQAAPIIVSCRSEYSTDQSTVSNVGGAPTDIVGATNAAPIIVATKSPGGYIATLPNGRPVVITGVRGNAAANGSWNITIPGTLAVIGATFASPIEITTAAPHGYPTNAQVAINGVTGNTAANGNWSIVVTGASTFQLVGSVGNAGFIAGGTCTPANLLSLTGSDGTITATNFAYLAGGVCIPISGQNTGSGQDLLGSPLVGLLIWGVGGAHNELEFDIPSPRLAAQLTPIDPNNRPSINIGSGIQVPISASHVSLWVRNDANLSPVNNLALDNWIGCTTAAKVMAFVCPDGGSSRAILTRTIYAVGGNNTFKPDSLASGSSVRISVPPFAKRVRIQAGGATLDVNCTNNVGMAYRFFSIPSGWEDWVDFDPQTSTLEIFNRTSNNINWMQCVFDVSPI
jgi:hypothetical protein